MEMGIDVSLSAGLAIEAEAYNVNRKTEDREEEIRAFNEKFRPQWRGR